MGRRAKKEKGKINGGMGEATWEQRRNQAVKRLLTVGLAATLLLVGLGGRLFYLQIFQYERFAAEVNRQRSFTIPLSSGRGMILDRNLVPLTDRETETVALVFPQLFLPDEGNIQFLSQLTGLSPVALAGSLGTAGYPLEFSVSEEPNWQDKRIVDTRGLFVVKRRRRYATEPVLSHTIGYISSADRRGLTGIEKALDAYLANQSGVSLTATVDGRKRLLPGGGFRLVKSVEPQQDVVLTVDYQVQKLAEAALDQKGYQGAVVVSRVETGEILALVSRPDFDPSQISRHLNSTGDELYHRAIQMTFPPGSIFKIVVAATALEQGFITGEERFFCTGSEVVGNVEIKCSSYDRGGNGELSFSEAFSRSCNSAFIQMGQQLGALQIMEMAKKFGLGEKVDLLLPEEEAGYLPQGDQLLGPAIGNLSIGQGEIEVTPLQVNQLTQMIANDGLKQPLYLLEQVWSGDQPVHQFQRGEASRFLSPETVAALQQLMAQTMTAGTGRTVGEAWRNVTAGKTGTAQSSFMGQSVVHGWFTGYYPVEEPRYAITVFLQNGQSGSSYAVPVFRQILEGLLELGM